MGRTIMELKNEQEALIQESKTFLERSRNYRTGLVPADAMERYNSMTNRIEALGNEVKVLEKQKELEREIFGGADDAGPDLDTFGVEEKVDPTASRRYATAFMNMVRGAGSVQHVMDALSVGQSQDGGYTVPDEFDRKLTRGLLEHNTVRRLAKVIRTESGMRRIPVGVGIPQAGWIAEGDPVPASDAHFDQIMLGAYKLGVMIRASNELLHDSFFDLEEYISDTFGISMGDAEEKAFISGTGVGQPTGLLHEEKGAGVGAVTGDAGKVSLDDVMKLFYSLPSAYRKNAVFLCGEDTLMQLRLIKDGNGNYIWKPGMDDGEPDTILGKRIYTSSNMPELKAGNKPMLFGDFSYYWIADRGKRTFRRLDEIYATADHVGFMSTQRVDGRLILPEAVKALRVKE